MAKSRIVLSLRADNDRLDAENEAMRLAVIEADRRIELLRERARLTETARNQAARIGELEGRPVKREQPQRHQGLVAGMREYFEFVDLLNAPEG